MISHVCHSSGDLCDLCDLCVSLLVCTPVGLSRMFTVMGQLLVKPTVSTTVWTTDMSPSTPPSLPQSYLGPNYNPLPLCPPPQILEDLDEQIYCIHLQEEALQRRLNGMSGGDVLAHCRGEVGGLSCWV